MKYWEVYVHDCVDFTTSSMTGARLMLISIHESSGSVYVLWVSKSMTWERWIVNFDKHFMVMWKCMRIDDFIWIFKVIFILEVLKIASLPFVLFCGCIL